MNEIESLKKRVDELEQLTQRQGVDIRELRSRLIQACSVIERSTPYSTQEESVWVQNYRFTSQAVKLIRDIDDARAIGAAQLRLNSKTP